ncbi:MAG TPA: hypothetical protein VGH88_02905 [Streptosporangiaceae bacterium]|jgi:hypothetical protein
MALLIATAGNRRLAALIATAGTVALAGCGSSAADTPGAGAAPPSAAAPASGTALAQGSPASPASPAGAGGRVHHITFTHATDDGYSYRVDVDVVLGAPTIDPTQADPGTTDIVLPISLQDGTLTNTTPGGHQMSTEADNISGLSLFAGPALPKKSYTCVKARTSLAFIQIADLRPYGGCGREVDNLIPQGQDPGLAVEVGPGQSIPLSLLQEDSEARPDAVTVNVPEADATRIAADFGSAEVCVVLGTLEGETYTYTAGTCG